MNIAKFLTVTSPQYKSVTKMMIESLKRVESDTPLIIENCYDFGSPEFNTAAFNRTTRFKAEIIGKYLAGMKDGEFLFYTDSDVWFFNKPDEIMCEVDRIFDMNSQDDLNGVYCAGFMAIKKSQRTLQLWQDIAIPQPVQANDQHILNVIIGQYGIKSAFFPPRVVTSYGLISGGKQWNGEEFEIQRCMAFHANFTVGIENKLKLMEKAKHAGAVDKAQ